MNEPLVENQSRLFPLRVASGLSLPIPCPLLPRPLRLRGAGGRRYSFREVGGGRTRLERRSRDGSVLGRILGRLGGCIINSLSTELTDRTSTGEAAPKHDYRVYDILIRYFENLKISIQQ